MWYLLWNNKLNWETQVNGSRVDIFSCYISVWAKLETSPCAMHLLFHSVILRSPSTRDFNKVFKYTAKFIYIYIYFNVNSEYIDWKNTNTGLETISQWKNNYLKTQLFWDWFVFEWGVLKWIPFKHEYIWCLEVAQKYYWCPSAWCERTSSQNPDRGRAGWSKTKL